MINAIKYSREIIMFEFLSVTIIMFASLSGNMKSNNFLSPSDSRTLVPSYVYTPNNTLVNTWDRSDEELSLSEVTYYNNYISSHYPNAIFISNATRIYNCHSYAWYMQSSQHNKHWMDSPSNYILDNSYYQVVASPQIGDIICYINSDGSKIHSGRIENIFPGTSNNVCGSSNLYQVISKWGIYAPKKQNMHHANLSMPISRLQPAFLPGTMHTPRQWGSCCRQGSGRYRLE